MSDNKNIRIVSTKRLSDEWKNIFTVDNNCYLSGDKKKILIADKNKFNSLGCFIYVNDNNKKYTIQLFTIKHWIKRKYKCKCANYFGYKILLSDYAESAEEMCELWVEDGTILTNEWEDILDNYLKQCVIVELTEYLENNIQILDDIGDKKMEEVLQNMKNEGYDDGIMRESIKNILNK